jgi:hypothetical protein
MKFDWQTVAVILIVLAACAYLARIAQGKLRAMRGRGNDTTNGCSGCGNEKIVSRAPAPKVLVQLGRKPTTRNTSL